MQNWILDFDFIKSASYLDTHRLQANIYENIQGYASIFDLTDKLVNPKKNRKNHSNIKRWIGYEQAYMNYIHRHLLVWKDKYGIKDNSINYENFLIIQNETNIYPLMNDLIPIWITQDLINQHRQILLERNPKHYSKYFLRIKID